MIWTSSTPTRGMMKMIGLFDFDFNSATKVGYPSLLLMKMASYLSELGKDYRMLSSADADNRYDKIYFFSEKELTDIPTKYYLIDNIEFFGKYFTTEIPEMVHYSIPDVSIYNDLIRQRLVEDTVTTKKALEFLDSSYYLAKYNGQNLPLPPTPRQRRMFIYDNDFLSYDDCWTILDKVFQKYPTSVYFINPIQCHNMKQFLYLREEYEKVSRSNEVMLDFYVPPEELEIYFGKYKLKLLGEITKTSNVGIYLGKNYQVNFYGNDFYVRNLLYCLNLIFSYYSRNIPIQAKIWEPVGENNPYYDFYKCLKAWTNHKNYDLVLDESFSRTKKTQERKDEFLKLHPIFKPFFEKSKNDLIKTRGIWRLL